MCAIRQLVSAPLNPIPIAEHFRRSYPQCELMSYLTRFVLKLMHQSIPLAPPPPPPSGISCFFFLPWMANSRGWGLFSCQIPRGGDKKREQMPRPLSERSNLLFQHFIGRFLFQLTSSFVIALGF